MQRLLIFCVILFLTLSHAARAAETQFLYLSGKGKDDGVKWDFVCNAGMNANKASQINVPSNWELQGFGIYSYGTDKNPNGWPKVQGKYKRTFTTPADWKNLQTHIVFEGVMTDTQVFVNGKSAGPMHQGGYYRFDYDITQLLKTDGTENVLEVTVDDESADMSVNRAERRGDYWNYAGIFRPVYLEAFPAESHIERLAIDAKADGSVGVDVFHGIQMKMQTVWWIKAQVLDTQGKPVGDVMTGRAPMDNTGMTHLAGKISGPLLWNAETPNLYQLEVSLGFADRTIHSVRQKFGFRTIEARANEGLFVNGQRIMLKGADRHSFWPDSGRCLSEEVSRGDIAVMKEMNMNAVRMSHYPPDVHFLDACDEMGMYVLDELAGWHAKYDDGIGHQLVEAMVKRDVNHPCVLFWDNGNEGGWNNNLNDDFAKWDPQKRNVLHPWELFRGVDTKHYPDYNTVVQKSAGPNVFFPTEMLHGLYDGGAGAGLEDYWNVMVKSKVSAGGIIWSLVDEDVKRVDKGGKLDSNGNQAPDGILGPYREKEGSFYAIKQLWSPVVMLDAKWPAGGVIHVENRFAFTNLDQCTFTWETRTFTNPSEPGGRFGVGDEGIAKPKTPIAPGTSGELAYTFQNPPKPGFDPPFSAFAVTAKDPSGKELWTTIWPTPSINLYRGIAGNATPGEVTSADSGDDLVITANELKLSIGKKTGVISAVEREGKPVSISGPFFVAALPPPPAPARGAPAAGPQQPVPQSTFAGLAQKMDGKALIVTASFNAAQYGGAAAGMKSITYTIRPNGWITVDYAYGLSGTFDYFGVGFDLPEKNVESMKYLGNGPATVYKNRLAGGILDIHEKKAENTIVGDPDSLAPGKRFDYPIMKGYYNNVKWLMLRTTQVPITALVNQDDLFVQVLTPNTLPANQIGQTAVQFPKTNLSFLHAIPAIGSKFVRATTTGPEGQPTVTQGDHTGSISLYFGDVPK